MDVDEVDLGNYKLGDVVELTIGEGDTRLSELFDTVLMCMKEGETSYVKARFDAKGDKVGEFDVNKKALKFNVLMKSLNRAADGADLEQDERLDRAQHHKDKGSELFQKSNLEYAIKRYEKAASYLSEMDAAGESLPEGLDVQYKKLLCQCNLNLAACDLKREKFEDAISHCSKALQQEPGNVKGLFRRGQAYTKMHQYVNARQDLLQALQMEPDNKAVRNQLTTVDQLVKKEKQMYQKMFEK